MLPPYIPLHSPISHIFEHQNFSLYFSHSMFRLFVVSIWPAADLCSVGHTTFPVELQQQLCQTNSHFRIQTCPAGWSADTAVTFIAGEISVPAHQHFKWQQYSVFSRSSFFLRVLRLCISGQVASSLPVTYNGFTCIALKTTKDVWIDVCEQIF